jgi:hypothetical protein
LSEQRVHAQDDWALRTSSWNAAPTFALERPGVEAREPEYHIDHQGVVRNIPM